MTAIRWLTAALMSCAACGGGNSAATQPAQDPTRGVAAAEQPEPLGVQASTPAVGSFDAIVRSRDTIEPRCGDAVAYGEVIAHTDDGRELRFLVACLEFARTQMGPEAGNAPVLVVGSRYRFTLEPSPHAPERSEAVRIDVIP